MFSTAANFSSGPFSTTAPSIIATLASDQTIAASTLTTLTFSQISGVTNTSTPPVTTSNVLPLSVDASGIFQAKEGGMFCFSVILTGVSSIVGPLVITPNSVQGPYPLVQTVGGVPTGTVNVYPNLVTNLTLTSGSLLVSAPIPPLLYYVYLRAGDVFSVNLTLTGGSLKVLSASSQLVITQLA